MDKNQFLGSLREGYQKDNFIAFLSSIGFIYSIPSIHIAGTNGKGSTASYIANIYEMSNHHVGLFTSPYLISINEMIKIDGVNISDIILEGYLEEYKEAFRLYDLSQFEVLTFIALDYFKKANCDVAIIECGMGGEFDATNIFTPILSIITSVSIEHSSYLGNSIAEIALHKAGIIKEEVPCLIGKLDEEALTAIKEVALSKNSPIFQVNDPYEISSTLDGSYFNYGNYKGINISCPALYSINDACLAIEAVNLIGEKISFISSGIYKGLAFTRISARFEIIRKNPTVIVDGSHNPEGVKNLIKSIEKMDFCNEIHVIFASFKDKNITVMLPELSSISSDITLTTFNHKRSRNEEDYFLFLEEYKFDGDYQKVIKEKLTQFPNDIILITGSLAFAGIVRDEFINGTY